MLARACMRAMPSRVRSPNGRRLASEKVAVARARSRPRRRAGVHTEAQALLLHLRHTAAKRRVPPAQEAVISMCVAPAARRLRPVSLTTSADHRSDLAGHATDQLVRVAEFALVEDPRVLGDVAALENSTSSLDGTPGWKAHLLVVVLATDERTGVDGVSGRQPVVTNPS